MEVAGWAFVEVAAVVAGAFVGAAFPSGWEAGSFSGRLLQA